MTRQNGLNPDLIQSKRHLKAPAHTLNEIQAGRSPQEGKTLITKMPLSFGIQIPRRRFAEFHQSSPSSQTVTSVRVAHLLSARPRRPIVSCQGAVRCQRLALNFSNRWSQSPGDSHDFNLGRVRAFDGFDDRIRRLGATVPLYYIKWVIDASSPLLIRTP